MTEGQAFLLSVAFAAILSICIFIYLQKNARS